ncbi:MAG: tRNA dimethylallyltransferase, partial [Cyclobacteriaceae bacterium]
GLYLQAITNGIDEMPKVPDEVRERYNQLWQEEGLEVLQEMVKVADPLYYEQVDRLNPVRLIRALEIIEVSGRPYSSFRKQRNADRPFDMLKVVLNKPREELYERINLRMDLMIERGLFEEAERLFPLRELPALQTVGYQEIFGYLEEEYDREEAVRLLKRNSRRYAKRQLTWFRKEEDWHWFHPGDREAIEALIRKRLAQKDQIG